MEVRIKTDIFVYDFSEVRLEKKNEKGTTGKYEVLYLGDDAHVFLPEGGFQKLIDKVNNA